MNSNVRRIFVEKKRGFDIEAQGLYRDLRDTLGIEGLQFVRVINRYDVEGISDEEYIVSRNTIFSEPPVDSAYDEYVELAGNTRLIAVEYLPGQYDQRADSASQCIQILSRRERPAVRAAKLIVLEGNISDAEYIKIKDYCINPVECREASLEKPLTLDVNVEHPGDVKVIDGFTGMTDEELGQLLDEMGLAMSFDDLMFCRDYFRNDEKRDPTETEIRVLDTYWSDHCRHTTFLTGIKSVEMEDGQYTKLFKSVYEDYIRSRKSVYGDSPGDICLMDIATIAMKELRKRGLLDDLDASDENNACSISVKADVGGETEEWLVMFKNETHNHPTEIEPFGGAATCLGGAIRDPLSGRAYVYQAMRVTGSGDPRTGVQDTIPGKLPQKKITTGAAAGYSSYGNQIGLATGQVAEIYDEGYVAKRMEIGAVIGAVPKANVIRSKPSAGDVVILLGGGTGRDGCGGATGSSKEHTEQSLAQCGAEVQKGNPPTERKIQRLFRNPDVSRMIKKCNDFGAGGVSVAIGELADGLDINLDAVAKKYEGLDGTELAISESQERMAVVVSPENLERFLEAANEENLEAAAVAAVVAGRRLRMRWRGKTIVDIGRDFLDTNGVRQSSCVKMADPGKETGFFMNLSEKTAGSPGQVWEKNMQGLNSCSQKGLVERFDSTVGGYTVLMPFGGRYQLTPVEGMAAKIPVPGKDTRTATLMTYGFNPVIAKWSPFHGAVYAIVEAVAKVVAMGGDYRRIRLSLQEYFEKLGRDSKRWGKPFGALLGAYYAQMKLGIPAIGGKDSMSGTFKDMTVPPTLVAFAVSTADAENVISPEFKKTGSRVIFIRLKRDEYDIPDFEQLSGNYSAVFRLTCSGKVLSAHSVRAGGISEAISRMCFGNKIGFISNCLLGPEDMFIPDYGSIVLEIPENADIDDIMDGVEYQLIGFTTGKRCIEFNGDKIDLDDLIGKWEKPLERIFQTRTQERESKPEQFAAVKMFSNVQPTGIPRGINTYHAARPRVFIPVFPGTNCEYETARMFEKAGGTADIYVFRNLLPEDIEQSIGLMVKKIGNSQIIVLPGGFSGGDEPDGSGKFIATVFRNPYIKDAVMHFLKKRDGLMLGICNGFQTLIKLGLVPFGEISDPGPGSPTLTFNDIGRHVSCMVRTRIVSVKSPWFSNVKPGDIHTIAVSHGEGRFVAGREAIGTMAENGQIATQYVDLDGNATYDIRFNPNGSVDAIEGITSPDGRILGKMGHSERIGPYISKNVPGDKDQGIFDAGIKYFG